MNETVSAVYTAYYSDSTHEPDVFEWLERYDSLLALSAPLQLSIARNMYYCNFVTPAIETIFNIHIDSNVERK